MKIALHIGFPKTGTTYFQFGLYQRLEEMRHIGVHVPTGGPFTQPAAGGTHLVNHNAMARAVDPNRKAFGRFTREQVATSWDVALSEIAAAASIADMSILSAEGFFWSLPDKAAVEETKRRLAGHDVHVFAVARDPVDFAESLYLQALKDWGFKGSARAFIGRHRFRFQLRSRLALWTETFGAERVKILDYADMPRESYFGQLIEAMTGHAFAEPSVPPRNRYSGIPQHMVGVFLSLNRAGMREEARNLAREMHQLRLPRAHVLTDELKVMVRNLARQ